MAQHLTTERSNRDLWLETLKRNGVAPPKSLHVVEVSGGLVQVTAGEPAGRISISGAPTHVLMFNLSPVQGLTQKRDGRSFVSDMLAGEMTLMPRGTPSEWSWKSVCDRLDVMVSTDVLGSGTDLDLIDRFFFRDLEIERICQNLYREMSLAGRADRLYIESLVIELAGILLRRHSRGSGRAEIPLRGGLTRPRAKRVLEYIESNLVGELTLRELANIAGLSAYHFARAFKLAIGVTPHRYILERRVERAKPLLRSTRTTLVDIGLSIGFCGQSHFTTAFRRLTGVTPTEYQQCNRRQP